MSNYWHDRFIELEKIKHDNIKKDYEIIEKNFDLMRDELNQKIENWYYRLAENNDISLDEAKKLLKNNELKEFKWSLKEYIKKGKENSINQKWIKELENASVKAHINRLEALKIQLNGIANNTFIDNNNVLKNTLKNTFKEQNYLTQYELTKRLKIEPNFSNIDDNKIDLLLNKPWSPTGNTFSNVLWNDKNKLIDNLYKEVTRNVILGKAPTDGINSIIELLNKDVKNKKYSSARLLQTESAFFAENAKLQAYKDLDVTEYEIIATLDNRTSDICQDMDKKHFKISDYMVGTTAPPFHVNCRTTTAPYFNDEFTNDLRVARDENGNTIYVEDISYKEWKKKYVDNNPNYVLKNKMDKNLHVDKTEFNKYKKVLKNTPNMPINLEEFQKIKYNNSEDWERIQDNYYIKNKINNKEFGTIINEDKQKPHNYLTKKDGKSYLFEGINAQELFDKYAGTGKVEKNRYGRTHKEICEANNIIGYCVNMNQSTSHFKIHHSKNRTHIVPFFVERR